MVLRTCRGILGDEHEAMDAFQATFLVLARKARSLWVRDSLGPWLHRVAGRAARRARAEAGRRRQLERWVADRSRAASPAGARDRPAAAVHEEVERLPGRYRAAVVLCDLEGRSYAEVAQHLGCPVGTVRSRLARGRGLLRDRLVRRGLGPAAALAALDAAAGPARAAMPAPLVKSTVETATRGAASAAASANALHLTREVLRIMLISRLKFAAAAALALGVAAAGTVTIARGKAAPPPAAGANPAVPAAAPPPAGAHDPAPSISAAAPGAPRGVRGPPPPAPPP